MQFKSGWQGCRELCPLSGLFEKRRKWLPAFPLYDKQPRTCFLGVLQGRGGLGCVQVPRLVQQSQGAAWSMPTPKKSMQSQA